MEYMSKYMQWLESDYFDETTKGELLDIRDDTNEIMERFYKELEFGTGGLRGIIGAGTNRINIYTIRKATQGLANYIMKQGKETKNKSVAIAYDSRRMSPEFADEAALVLNANGIKAYVFGSLRTTPELSFAVREIGCIAGIVITASHNPPEYNGYKVYWEDGAQITSPKDEEIINEVKNVTTFEEVSTMDKDIAKKEGLYNIIEPVMDDKYLSMLKKQIINPEIIREQSDNFVIIYTPLHGTGNIPVRKILKEVGFKHVHVVPEQELPDSNFSTVSYPNPEDINVFDLAIKLGKDKKADIILATDPDTDRFGVLTKNKTGEYIALTGNMIGIILLDYIITQKKENGKLPDNAAVIKTMVTTSMAKAVADYYQVELIEVLTGFKYIGEKIKEFEENNNYEYIFGFEESYGCLIGTHARDKDAVVATMFVCEVAAYYKSKGLTLYEVLINLYEKYGYYKESLEFITLKGIEGIEKIQHVLKELRNNHPKALNGVRVLGVRDYLSQEIKNLITNDIRSTNLPKSNALYFEMEDESWFCVRPSGTEPKVKFYFGVKGNSLIEVDEKINLFTKAVMSKIEEILR